MITQYGADDIVYTNLITGVHGNYMKPSLRNAGLDPDNLEQSDKSKMDFSSDRKKKWKDIWGAGQGIGAVKSVMPTADLVARLRGEYHAARLRLLAGPNRLLNPAWERVMDVAAE